MDFVELAAIIASVTALSVFILNQYGKLSQDNFWYDFLFFISSLVLLFYAYTLHAIPFMITNALWSAVSFIDVLRDTSRIMRAKKGARM